MAAFNAAVIQGCYADLKTVKTRSVVQLVIECPIEQGAEIVRMFGFPQPGKEVPVAVALLDGRVAQGIEQQPSKLPAEGSNPSAPAKRWSDMPRAQQAGILCGDPQFQAWVKHNYGTDDPATVVRNVCGVASRADLDSTPSTQKRWDNFCGSFRDWQRYGNAA